MSAAEKPAASQPERPGVGFADGIWRALNSLPVAIAVMVALALLSAVGTMIPQSHLDPQPPGMSFEQFLTQRYGADKYRLLHTLGLDHIYFTWYFGVLLAWLAISAVICNIVRYRSTVKLWRDPPVRRGARFFAADRRSLRYSAMPVEKSITAPALASASPQQAIEAVADDLKLQGFRVRRLSDGNTEMLYADRGFLKKWALVILHVAVLILLFGGMYGRAVGVEGNVRMADGETQTLTLNIADGKFDWLQPVLKLFPDKSYDLHQHGFRIDWGKKLVLETDILKNVPKEFHPYFQYYVHDYVSELEVSHGRRNVRREVIVNHPLVIEKLVLYQSGYEQRGYIAITDAAGNTREERLPDALFGPDTWYALTEDGIVLRDINSGRWFKPQDMGDSVRMNFLPAGTAVSNLSFKVVDNVKAGDLYHHGKKIDTIEPMAIFGIADSSAGTEFGSVLITSEKGFEPMLAGKPLLVRMAPTIEDYSIFSYKRDPGSPVLFTGWLLLVLGIAATMYIPFRQVWVRAEPGKLDVLPLGRGSGPQGVLAQRLNQILGVENAKPTTE